MLRRQNLGGRHDACLVTVVERYEGSHECHDGLSAAHIALKQTVHLPSAAHVAAHLADDALLRPGERERQHMVVEVVEVVAHAREDKAHTALFPTFYIFQDVELQEEQFLILHAELRPLQGLDAGGSVHIKQSLRQRHEVALCQQLAWQGLGDVLHDGRVKQVAHQLLHGALGDLAVVQLLGEAIHALQPLWHRLGLVDINLGMDDAVVILERRGFAEEQIFRAQTVGVLDVTHTVEPHNLDGARAIGEQRHQPLAHTLARCGEVDEPSTQLDIRHLTIDLVDVMNGAAVDVPEGEIVEQIVKGVDVQLLAQQLGTLRSHARQVLDVHAAQVITHVSGYFRPARGRWDV